MPGIQAFFDDATSTASFLVWDRETKAAAVIDAVLDFDSATGKLSTTSADRMLARTREQGLGVVWVLETHAHADHLSAADYIRRKTGARVGIGARITEVQTRFRALFGAPEAETEASVFDALFEDGEVFKIGGIEARVLHTPGHTPACVTYVINDAAFVGDTLFMPDYGTARADFPGGDATALYRSIRRILALPPETRIFVGHDYLPAGRSKPAWETTVADERAANIHVHDGVTEEDFVKLRMARDRTLAAPKLILPSLQVNIRGGALPKPEADGRIYLRTPVTTP
ncbi:MAG TPA: MBL fold metallo-hydrolase [Hyphomonadaceae bacterium]|nr:MBL fold metallo-hydrolase [Hyphomonadaceae bacterium]